uniref:Transcription factor atf21 n=1 Tax=Colletotrichum fructicola (strain Nara gc5) TaxID=1213859 RepID=L2G2B8_COLFN
MASPDHPCYPGVFEATDTAMFIPMALYPTPPGQNCSLTPGAEPQYQQWLGWDDHAVEPKYAENDSVDFVNPPHLEGGAQHLESSYFEMGVEQATATWASQANNWPPFQCQIFQQPPVNTYSGEAWPSPDAQSQTEPHSRAKKSTKPTEATNNTRSRPTWSAAQQSHKRAKIGAVGKPSPSSSNSYRGKVTMTDDDTKYEGEGDEVGEQGESWRPGMKKYRVKNRAAAKRCREKTKLYEEDLAVKEQEVTQERMYLDAYVAALKEEVLALKNQILQHGDCNCELIQGYIARTARASADKPDGLIPRRQLDERFHTR